MFRGNGILRTSRAASGTGTRHTRAPRSGIAISALSVVGVLAAIVCGGCVGGDQQQGVDAAPTWCASPFGAIPVGGFLKDGCTIYSCATGAVLDSSGGGCTCDYNGRTYPPGETFSAYDGCNTCTCEGSPQ